MVMTLLRSVPAVGTPLPDGLPEEIARLIADEQAAAMIPERSTVPDADTTSEEMPAQVDRAADRAPPPDGEKVGA